MIFPPELVLVSPVCPESACGAVSGGNLGSCGQMSGLWSLESGHWTSLGTSKYITITSHRSPACYRERSGAVTASNRSFIIRNPTIGHLSDWLSYNSYQCHQHRCCQHWTTPPSPLAENVLDKVTQSKTGMEAWKAMYDYDAGCSEWRVQYFERVSLSKSRSSTSREKKVLSPFSYCEIFISSQRHLQKNMLKCM